MSDRQWQRIPICLLFSLKEEADPFCKTNVNADMTTARKLRVGTTGLGWRNAAMFTQATIAQWSPEMLVICGFCGGLSAEVKPGDLTIASSVTAAPHFNPLFHPDIRLLKSASKVHLPGINIHTGALITTHSVLITPQEKKALAESVDGQIVDMETAAIVETAEQHRIPWVVIRAITDGVDDTLPIDFNTLADSDGNVDNTRVIKSTLLHPQKHTIVVMNHQQRENLSALHMYN